MMAPSQEISDNMVAMLHGVEDLRVQAGEMPQECGPWEAIVCPKWNGICGSDMHLYTTPIISATQKPFILGHESSGIVFKVGSRVQNLQPGERVALEPGEGCLRCEFCKSGQYAHCRHMRFAAASGVDGTLQRYYKLPADLCYKLPDNVSLVEGALMEPLSVAVNAVANISPIKPSSNVAVFGAGPVGLLTLAVAKAFGARRLIAIDVQQQRLDFVKQYLGADVRLASKPKEGEARGEYSQREANEIREALKINDHDLSAIDVAFDCSGQEVCVQTALWLLRRRGTLVAVGNGPLYQSVPMLQVVNRELNIKGSFRYGPGVYKMAIDLVERGKIDLKPLITHQFSFENVTEAFKTSRAGKSSDGKVAIKVTIAGPEN